MINIYKAQALAKIQKASQILAEVRREIIALIRPGITTLAIDQVVEQLTIAKGGKPAFLGYQGFPNAICASNNNDLIHGIPNEIKLEKGDLLSIDMGVIYEGYYADAAFSISVGGPNQRNETLIKVAKNAFFAGIKAIKPGARVGDISAQIGQSIAKAGYFTPQQYAGHGIGSRLHEDPYVENEGHAGTGPRLRDGMVICIEPMILQTSKRVKVCKDGWTVRAETNQKTAHYEHTILIKNGYPIILTGDENGE